MSSFHKPNRPHYHFSVDDVFGSLVRADRSCSNPAEEPFFAFLSSLNEEFGAAVDIYAFQNGSVDGRRRSLAEVSGRHRSWYEQAGWLRAGPHAVSYETAPHEQSVAAQAAMVTETCVELERIMGRASLTSWVRFHYFGELYSVADDLMDVGITTLLLTDKETVSYELPEPLIPALAASGRLSFQGLELRRSHGRLERFVADGLDDGALADYIERAVDRHGYVSIFTHESDCSSAEVREMAFRVFRIFSEMDLVPVQASAAVSAEQP